MFLSARSLAAAVQSLPLLLLAFAQAAPAQQLALRTYTARDGLAHGRINCIHQDHRGYLWFGTWEGLSRFDGQRFVNYGVADGLPNPFIDCITEDHDGGLWVGTLGGGFARMREQAAPDGRKFDAWHVASTPRADDITDLLFDRDGCLWIAAGAGIYRGVIGVGVVVEPMLVLDQPDVTGTTTAAGAPAFFGTGVRAVGRDGALATAPLPLAADGGAMVDVIGRGDDLFLLRERELLAGSTRAVEAPLRAVALPLQADEKLCALAATAAVLWVGTTQGLLERRDGVWRRYGRAQGLPDDQVRCLFVDQDQVLWIGMHRGGVARLADRAVSSYGAREGFADCNVSRVVETPDGRLYASTESGGIYEVLADRVVRLTGAADPALEKAHMRFCCDRRGDFWLGSERGLWFCPGPRLDLQQCRRLGVADGLPEVAVCAEIREMPDGSLWFGAGDGTVYRRDATAWASTAALAPLGDPTPCRVMLATGGDVLLASFDHLWRLHGADCTRVPLAADAPLRPRCLFTDRRGWTWIGTRFLGVFVQRPKSDGGLLHLGSRDGLASDAVWSIAEDRRGRVFLGTAHGISCFDPAVGAMRPFGGSDGPAGEVVNHLCCASTGRLWAATSGGLSCFDLDAPPRVTLPPRVYLAHVQVDGAPLPLPENGTGRLGGLVLTPGQRNLDVEFTGLDFHSARPLRYQHQLMGAEADWSPITASGMVQFANLAAGDYRFVVRAVDADGRVSSAPAELAFIVLPPVWQRTWFVALALLLLLALAWVLHLARLRAAIATERLRTQIATDLHDEVGAGLAQIAILSEVARRQAEPTLAANLGEVAGLARTLREGMSEIVWALAKGHETLADLVQHMRQLCSRMLEVDGTMVAFSAPTAAELDAIVLSLEQRRQLWLWFKEALTNVARHAAAGSVDIAVAIDSGRLRLSVRDDGAGFEPLAATDGHGLPSLQRRSQRLGGIMQLSSRPGAGTTLDLLVPLRQRRRRPA